MTGRDAAIFWSGLAALAAALVIGVPMFVRMPPWCDLTLYQVASANVQNGGVLYRDVFDTNLPGFIAALTVVRTLFGPSVEAVRIADLCVVGATLYGLYRWVRAAGSGRAAATWFLAGCAWFYLFTSEFNHCQRDVWMLLPASAAAGLRSRRLMYANRHAFWPAFLEGCLWGLAVWIKPHVVFPAFAVWFVTVTRLGALTGWRGILVDLFGLVLGGALVGAAGVALLVVSGTWDHFREVFEFWNTGYVKAMWWELRFRGQTEFKYFVPWNYLHIVAIPTAVRSLFDAPWRGKFDLTGAHPGLYGRLYPAWMWDAGPTDAARFARLTLAAFYLVWTAQAIIIQRGFHYVHVPEILLLLAVLATQRWLPGALMLAWLTISTTLVKTGLAPDESLPPGFVSPRQSHAVMVVHPLLQYDRYKEWPDCFRFGLSDEDYFRRWDRLALVRDFFPANDWRELAQVADELRSLGVKDGEVIAWHDAPHAIYTLLPSRPGFRFQHVTAMMAIGPKQEQRVWEELEALPPGRKWAVTDLHRVGFVDKQLLPDFRGAGPDLMPPALSARARRMFPLDQPAIFRSTGPDGEPGRYVLHEITKPLRRPY